MINTKDIEVTIGPSTYKVSVDYEQDGSIVAVVIAGDIRELPTRLMWIFILQQNGQLPL